MIAVIADDFTGAAEIGGVGLKYGLKVIIETKVNEALDADLVIIATDTRSLSVQEAEQKIKSITNDLIQLKPTYIYKKLDSVLRGNISNELIAQMIASNKKRAIVVAGNPKFGRSIKDGVYTINSVPLDKTDFVNDADFPVSSSLVLDIIKKKGQEVISTSVNNDLPIQGVIIGDVSTYDDMQNWVSKIDDTTVAAGGAGFFDVILSNQFTPTKLNKQNTIEQGNRTLFVFGSTFPKSNGMAQRLAGTEIVKKNMPKEIYFNKVYDSVLFTDWVSEVVASVQNHQTTIISVEHENSDEIGLAIRVKKTVAELVKRVMQQVKLTDLFIEGGATASEILNSLDIAKLYPFIELDLGIIQMKVDEYPNLRITTKPGSYLWPEKVRFENLNDANTVKNG